MRSLAISIVTYAPDLPMLATVLERLNRALLHAYAQGLLAQTRLVLVDNGPGPDWFAPLQRLLAKVSLAAELDLLSGHGNVGYGAGHNLALARSVGDFHLVLNPDVLLEEDALSEGLAFLAAYPDTGLVAPVACDGHGQPQAGGGQGLCGAGGGIWLD